MPKPAGCLAGCQVQWVQQVVPVSRVRTQQTMQHLVNSRREQVRIPISFLFSALPCRNFQEFPRWRIIFFYFYTYPHSGVVITLTSKLFLNNNYLEVFGACLQPLQTNPRILPWNRSRPFPPNQFKIIKIRRDITYTAEEMSLNEKFQKLKSIHQLPDQ